MVDILHFLTHSSWKTVDKIQVKIRNYKKQETRNKKATKKEVAEFVASGSVTKNMAEVINMYMGGGGKGDRTDGLTDTRT